MSHLQPSIDNVLLLIYSDKNWPDALWSPATVIMFMNLMGGTPIWHFFFPVGEVQWSEIIVAFSEVTIMEIQVFFCRSPSRQGFCVSMLGVVFVVSFSKERFPESSVTLFHLNIQVFATRFFSSSLFLLNSLMVCFCFWNIF